ncbi:hypothetical protein MA16_Dca029023 [Dendrobium catenatum]|uniref:Uncharacterized protein n=1 Tax=Dendrobium catenatum TaxID=906689 RepID=A0A2I0VFV6_9ASPA|nr:hypothetical protein MA16_Dca029023 [Dendrobium catenatum]
MSPKLDAQKRCLMILRKSCNHYHCKARCLKKKNGIGLCSPSPVKNSYECLCVYDC